MYDSTADSGALGAVEREPRLSDRVADGILETILSRRLTPGDSLPGERELGEQFGVSRTVIREAVRTLAAKGLLEVRTGRRIRVAAVDARTPRDAIRQYVRRSAPGARAIAQARHELEIAAAGIAAVRADAEDLDALRSQTPDPEAFARALVTASHNELLALFHAALADGAAEPAAVAAASDARGRLVEAIVRRDADAARAAMRELDH